MSSSNRVLVSILAVVALAIGFWALALGPKRQRADELGTRVEQLQASLQEAQGQAAQAEAAKREFAGDYRQLVVLGKAVPASDETSSLLVELDHVAVQSGVKFESIQLSASSEEEAPAATPVAPPTTATSSASPSAVPASASVPPTEIAASTMPLGASIGTAGLGVMPYNLSFRGDFFHVADFIHGIDSLVHTGGGQVAVDGRLITLDGFALEADAERGFPYLDANFTVTTYLTPPSQGLTAGATSAAPPPTATPAAEAPTAEAPPATSETVSTR